MLSREEVLRIARLARLELDESEVTLYQGRLGRVLDYIKELSQLDTPKEAFVKHIPKDAVCFREDRALPFANRKGLLENAPAAQQDNFHLPVVLEQE